MMFATTPLFTTLPVNTLSPKADTVNFTSVPFLILLISFSGTDTLTFTLSIFTSLNPVTPGITLLPSCTAFCAT